MMNLLALSTSAIASVIPIDSVPCEHGFSMSLSENKRAIRLMDVHVDNLMLIAMEGPKLEVTETSAVICRACTEFYSRRERQKFS